MAQKKHVLVFWIKSGQTSVILEEDLIPNANEDEVTSAKYGARKKYEVKVLRKSYDERYLKSLQVSKDGNLIPPKKKSPNVKTLNDKSGLKRKADEINCKRKDISQKKSEELLESPSIFDDSRIEPDEEAESVEKGGLGEASSSDLRKKPRKQNKNIIHSDSEGEGDASDIAEADKSYENESDEQEEQDEENCGENSPKQGLSNKDSERHDTTERQRELERARDEEGQAELRRRRIEERREELQRQLERETEEQQQAELRRRRAEERLAQLERLELEREAEELEQQHEEGKRRKLQQRQRDEGEIDQNSARENGRRDVPPAVEGERQGGLERENIAVERQEENGRGQVRGQGNAQEQIEEVDPVLRSRQAGGGRILLCNVYNVWIDRGRLTWMQRFFDDPRELTRRLLKELVGEDNLKGMCARGRSRATRPVPREILDAVEYYVNKTSVKRLTPVQFTNTVNMMCSTLRHPRH